MEKLKRVFEINPSSQNQKGGKKRNRIGAKKPKRITRRVVKI